MNQFNALKEKGLMLDILSAQHKIETAKKSLETDPSSAEEVDLYVAAKLERLQNLRACLYALYSQYGAEKHVG